MPSYIISTTKSRIIAVHVYRRPKLFKYISFFKHRVFVLKIILKMICMQLFFLLIFVRALVPFIGPMKGYIDHSIELFKHVLWLFVLVNMFLFLSDKVV